MTEPLTTHHSPLTKTDWLLIGVLITLVLPLRLWLLYNTEVTARDSIGYIRYALQFEQYSWQEVLTKNHQHPGYPALVWLMSLPVRAIDGATTPDNMERSTQLVNLFASLLLIVPMYFLGRQFFDRTVSFWSVILYQYLPISAQHLSDGISEPIFLVLLVSGLLQGVHAIRERTVWRCVLCGLFAGLAYLTRPEGALILPAFTCVLIVLQFRSEWRCPWQRFFACGTSALVTAALIAAFYVAATGRITNKLSAIETLNNLVKLVAEIFCAQESPAAALEGGRCLFSDPGVGVPTPATGSGSVHLFAVSFPTIDNKGMRLLRSAWALISEVCAGFHYVAGIPALLGFWWTFGSLRRRADFWVVMAFSILHSFILIALAMSVSYVSDRHVMILVLGGCFFAVAGLRELPRRVLALCQTNLVSDATKNAWKMWYRSAPVWFGILLFALIAFCLPKATQRLHGNRVGNHEAGLWLAKQIDHNDNANIVDDHAWSHFFSGLIFQEGRESSFAKDHPSKCYVVTTRSRDPLVHSLRQSPKLAKNAEVVFHWPEHDAIEKARVVVYVQPRLYDEYPWPLR
jgi:4-amino-4-deoxy-L-arabinose transferase-like glycosyltransferase